MSKRKRFRDRLYSIVRSNNRYYWVVWNIGCSTLLAQGWSNNYRGAFWAVRNFMKRNQNEVFNQ